jgi:hypothetical protein
MLRAGHVSELIRASGARVGVVLGSNKDADVWSTLVPHLRKTAGLTRMLDYDADGPTEGSDGSLETMRASENQMLEFQVPGRAGCDLRLRACLAPTRAQTVLRPHRIVRGSKDHWSPRAVSGRAWP